MQTTSTITCPVCGGTATEPMPVDACQIVYACMHCGTVLRPRPGDCCVFCSYGDIACPPQQGAGLGLQEAGSDEDGGDFAR